MISEVTKTGLFNKLRDPSQASYVRDRKRMVIKSLAGILTTSEDNL